MKTFTITIGTTPVDIFELLTRHATYSGASVANSKYLDPKSPSTCEELTIIADDGNSNFIYIGDSAAVASTDYGIKLAAGFEHRSKSKQLSVPLHVWVIGGAAGQKLHIKYN